MIIAGASLLLAVAVVAVGVWLVVSGRVVVTFVAGGKGAGSVSRVCGDSIVATFNEAATYKVRDDSSDRISVDETGLDRVVTNIRNNTGHGDDATCQTILLRYGIIKGDAGEASRALGEVKRLHDLAEYANNNLTGVDSLVGYQTSVEQLSLQLKGGRGGY